MRAADHAGMRVGFERLLAELVARSLLVSWIRATCVDATGQGQEGWLSGKANAHTRVICRAHRLQVGSSVLLVLYLHPR